MRLPAQDAPLKDNEIVASVQHWVKSFVVELNLCPFAKRELMNDRIRFALTTAHSEKELVIALQTELELLNQDDSIETTLLIHTEVLQDFYDYNQFLSVADQLLRTMSLEGVYQIASFHPHYQFDGTHRDDAENYTNRSPHPLLHLLREESLTQAIANTPDIDQVPIRNIEQMNRIGKDRLHALLQASIHNHGDGN